MDLITVGQTNTNVVEGWDWFVWDFHPSISIGLGILTALYFWVIGPARRRWNLGREATKLEKGFFISAVVTLELSLDGPIHHLADNYLFSVHMFQHLMITLIGPLLLLAGIPGWVWEQVLRVPVLGAVFRWAVKPVWAFLIYNGVLIAFHLPGAYNATMVDHNIHILEHLLFMASAVLVWADPEPFGEDAAADLRGADDLPAGDELPDEGARGGDYRQRGRLVRLLRSGSSCLGADARR